jgi:predicted DNA-binding protein
VTPRKLQLQSLYLEPNKAELLDALADETRIPKAVLLREAVDDLLIKHKKSKRAKDNRRTGS